MGKNEANELYDKIYKNFIDLMNGKIDEIKLTPAEILELNYLSAYNYTILHNYGDVLEKDFGNKVQCEIDLITGGYIFRRINDK